MYDDSHALSSDSSPIFPPNPRQKEEQNFPLMEPEYRQQFTSQNPSGLLRFRSAPTSLLESFTEKTTPRLGVSRFCSDDSNSVKGFENEKDDDGGNKGFGSRFGGVNLQLPPQYPRQSGAQMGYRGLSSVGVENQGQSRLGSSFVRQNSLPAGFLSHLNPQNGYPGARGIGGNADSSPYPSGFKNHMNFPPISEVDNETGGANMDEAKVGNSSGDDLLFSSGFPFGSWNDSSYFAENITIKREVDHDPKLFLNPERLEGVDRPNMLSHHLSMPKSSPEMAAMEKLLQLQDTVPCKVRAKRGFATHPRSIAERVRRTRISERMRKLQELVPHMDKQTNTADMLDLAVEYIKGLQNQYKVLNDLRANCKCSAFPKS